MMDEAIKKFPEQFSFEPEIENAVYFVRRKKFIIVGMGGSHLAADILKMWQPELDLQIHKNYGLPVISDHDLNEALVILSSYSGNTEEVIDAFNAARKKNCTMVIVAVGGKLLDLAKEHKIAYIQIPNTGIQPRMALGFSFKALLKIIGDEVALKTATKLASTLKAEVFEVAGRELAKRLQGFVPIIYSSEANWAIAYNWKIKFNETGKIPAFFNMLPEMNHNEMTGFDIKDSTKQLSQKFRFLLLTDAEDHPRIIKRMTVLQKMYHERGLPVELIKLEGKTIFEKIFSNLLLADWTAYYTATFYGVDPEKVPLVEELKKLMSS